MAIGFLVVGSLAGWVAMNPTPAIEMGRERRVEPTPIVPKPAPEPEQATVEVLTPYYRDLELGFRSERQVLPIGENPKVYAVNRYLDSVTAAPAGARARTCVVNRGVATLDFASEFATSYGTFDEQLVVVGVLRAMGQFPEVHSVQITVDGRPIETLGNIDLLSPLPVVRPEDRPGRPEPSLP